MNKFLTTLLLLFFMGFYSFGQNLISIEPRPLNVFIEKGENKQFLNFDFLVVNNSTDTLSLSKVVVSVYDKKRHLVLSRFLDNNGTAPSIHIIPNIEFNGKETKLIFNPFSEFNLSVPLDSLTYEFTFTNSNREDFIINTLVVPINYEQKEKYVFPLEGKILVYDGHDFFSHHRRFDFEFAPIKQLGISSNFMRYAYDFVMLDSADNQFQGDPDIDENYFGFGKSVYAIADGQVIYASNRHKDDKTFDVTELLNDPLELYGNCIAIQHKNGAISIYGHLRQNSLQVKIGDNVKAKKMIASIGVSGSSFFPHLHFEVRNSIKNSSEGLPSYFSNIFLFEGNTTNMLKSGLAETGNVIYAK